MSLIDSPFYKLTKVMKVGFNFYFFSCYQPLFSECRPLSTAKEVIHHINNHPEALALNIAEYGAELQKYRNLHHASNAQGVIWRVGGGSNKDTFISAFNAAMRQHHTQHPSLYGDSAPLKAIAYHAQLDLKTSVFDFLVADLSLIRAVDHPPLKVGFMLKSNVAGDVILQMVGRLLRHWPEFPHAEAHLFVLPFHVKLLQSVSPLIRSDDQQIPIHASISQFQEEITAEKIDTEIGLLLNLSSPAVIPPPPPLPTAECNILANVAERKILTAPTVVPPPPPLPTAECQALSSPASLPTAQQDNVVVAPVPPTGRTLRPRRSIPVNEQWVDSKPAKKRAKISVKMPKLLDMDIDEGDEGDEAFEMTFSESESSSSESESDDDVYAPESEDSVEEEEDMADDESDGESKGAALISTSDAANIKPKAGKKKRKSTHAISSTTEQHLNLLHESPPECKGCGKRNTIFQGKYRRFLRKKALFGQYTRESEVYARAEYYLPSTTKSGRIINCSTCLVRLKQEAIQARVNTQCEHTDCSVVFIAPPDHGDDVTVGTAKRQKGGLMNEPYMKLRAKLESVSLYPIKEGVVIIGYKSESYCKSHLGNKDAKLDPYSKIRYVPTTEDANTGDWGSVERVALLERTHGEVIKKVHQFQLNTQERQRLFQDEFKPTVKSVIDEDWATSYYQTIVNDRSVVDTPWSALEDETLALFLELVIAQPLQYPVLVLMRDLLENKVLIPDDFLRKVKSERWPGFAIFSIADFMFNASLPLEHPSNQTPLVILNIQGHWQLNPRFDMRLRRALQQQLPNSEPTKTYMDILRDLRPPPVSAEAEVETESDTEAESIPDHRKKRATAKKPTSQLTRDYAHFILAHLTNQWVPRKHLTKCLQANHEQLQMNLHSLKPDQNNNTIVSTWLTKIQAFLHRQIVVRDDHYWKLKQACDFCHQMGSCVCQPQECFCQPCATCNVGHFCKNGKVDNHMCHTGCHACTPRRRAPRFSKESETKDRLNPQAVKKICKFVQLAKLRFGQTPHPRDSWQSLAVEVGITSFSSNFQHLTATTTTLKSAWCFNFPYLVPRENNLFALAPEFFG